MPPLLPVMLRLENRMAVVIGGGPVALRRVTSLLECGATVRLIAPEAHADLKSLATAGKIQWHQRGWQRGDLHGVFFAVAATSDSAVNEAVAAEAATEGVLINRADEADAGDVQIPAHHRAGPLTLAVHTAGASAAAAVKIRDALAEHIDPAWPGQLAKMLDERAKIKAAFPPGRERENRLRQETDRLIPEK